MPRLLRVLSTSVVLVAAACQPDPGQLPSLDALRQPSGLAVSPTGPVLFVTNGNWDRQQEDGTLMAVDLDALFMALADPADAGDGGRPCRRVSADDPTIECNPSAFIDAQTTVRLGTGAANIAIDRPGGPEGPLRLLMPTRSPVSVTWVDVLPGEDGVTLDCGQDDAGRCGVTHEITRSANARMPNELSRISVDTNGARFAYAPQVLGEALALIALDGDNGPELADVEGGFFRAAPFEEEELFGGFSVAVRPCDPERAPDTSVDCSRPVAYAAHRYFPGMRQLTVAEGLDLILPGEEIALQTINPQVVEGRPYMGDMAFEDDTGDRLLVVQTTPPGLLRVDTSVDDDGDLANTIIGAIPLCDNPNVLAVHRPVPPVGDEDATPGESLALVTCATDGRLSVIGLGSFRVLASIPVGEGAYEVVVDDQRAQAYVSNPGENTISIVSLDPTSPDRFVEWARLGLGAGTRE
ncbi:MAG: hypothetical protein AAF799_43495 [Myxococcota bacterium]